MPGTVESCWWSRRTVRKTGEFWKEKTANEGKSRKYAWSCTENPYICKCGINVQQQHPLSNKSASKKLFLHCTYCTQATQWEAWYRDPSNSLWRLKQTQPNRDFTSLIFITLQITLWMNFKPSSCSLIVIDEISIVPP